jgi:hypothetical protein
VIAEKNEEEQTQHENDFFQAITGTTGKHMEPPHNIAIFGVVRTILR